MEFFFLGAKHVLSVIVSHVLVVARSCFLKLFSAPVSHTKHEFFTM